MVSLQTPIGLTAASLAASILAVLVAGISLYLTYRRDQRDIKRDLKRVQMLSSIHFGSPDEDVALTKYRVTVTNIGNPGIEIARVGLTASREAGMAILLNLAPDAHQGFMNQGQSQIWETYITSVEGMNTSNATPFKPIAVATDTTGKEYFQDPSDSVPISL